MIPEPASLQGLDTPWTGAWSCCRKGRALVLTAAGVPWRGAPGGCFKPTAPLRGDGDPEHHRLIRNLLGFGFED